MYNKLTDIHALNRYLNRWEEENFSYVNLYNRNYRNNVAHKQHIRSMKTFFSGLYRHLEDIVIDKYQFTIPSDIGAIEKIIEYKNLIRYINYAFKNRYLVIDKVYHSGDPYMKPAIKCIIHQDNDTKDIVLTSYFFYKPGIMDDELFDIIFDNYYSEEGNRITYTSKKIHNGFISDLSGSVVGDIISTILLTKNIYIHRKPYAWVTKKRAVFTSQSKLGRYK